MTNWHPSGEPFTPHNAPKYWQGVAQTAAGHTPRPTVGTRNDRPQVQSWQPPINSAKVITSGLADGPSG